MYKAHRDERFEYAHDVIHFIQERQCGTCAFQNDDPVDTMCDPIAIGLILEESLPDLDDRGDDGVHCRLYRSVDDYTHPDPLQMELFE